MTRSWNLADAPGISLSMSAATASVAIVLSRAPCMWAERVAAACGVADLGVTDDGITLDCSLLVGH